MAARPPALARRLLALRFRGECREVVEGDLLEYFERDLAAGWSARAARRRYWRLVLESLVTARQGSAVPAANGAAWVSPMRSVWSDTRLSIRRLAASPGFTVTAVLTLALAIGVNAALYTALRRVVLDPVPFDGGDRMVLLWRSNPTSSFMLTPTRDEIDRWSQLTGTFEWVESYRARSLVILDGGEPEEVLAGEVGPDLLARLGVTPGIGRPLAAYDSDPDTEPVLLLGDAIWRARFGGDPEVVGTVVRMGDEHWRIIGVLPGDFRLPFSPADLWIPRRGPPPERGANALALLRDGVTVDEATAALRAMPVEEDAADGNWFGSVMEPSAMFGRTVPQTLVLLSGAVGLLLLMACVNIAGLVMSRHRRRQREFALRLSLGASRVRLFRLLMVENALVAVAGGLSGLVAAHFTLAAISALRPETLGALDGLGVDGGVVSFALVLTGITALLFGALPAWHASRRDVARDLASGGRAASARGMTARGVLGGLQIAVALVLLVGTMLLSRSLLRLTSVDPGFNPDGLVELRVTLRGGRYEDAEAKRLFREQLDASILGVAGVTAVATGSGLPPTLGIIFGAPELEGGATGGEAEVFGGGWAGPGYFRTLGVPVIEGREFADVDTRSGASSVIVSEGLAERLGATGGRGLVGSRFRMDSDSEFSTIVGVVGNVVANGAQPARDGQVYLPPPASPSSSIALAVRTDGDPGRSIEAIKARVWALDPDLAVGSITTVADTVWRQAAAPRFGMTLLSAFAVAGLVLAGVGVFGTLAIVAAERRRDVAVRQSLGATPWQAIGLVLRYLLWITSGGVVVGLGSAYLLAPRVQPLLYEVAPLDAMSFVLACLVVVLAATAAAIAPVRRVLSVDPAEALRSD